MPAGGSNVVVPFRLPPGANATTTTGTVTVFTNGPGDVTVQLYGANGAILAAGVVVVGAGCSAPCAPVLGANLFLLASLGAVRLSTTEGLVLTGGLRVASPTGTNPQYTSGSFGDLTATGGAQFAFILIPTAYGLVVTNPNPASATLQVTGSLPLPAPIQLGAYCTTAIALSPTATNLGLTVSGAAEVAASYVNTPVLAIT